MDRKIRKLISIHGEIHPRSCVDDLFILRCDGGSGLVCVEHSVEEKKCSLTKFATQSKEALVKTAPEKYIVNVSKKEKKGNRLKKWKGKAPHVKFVRETKCHNESKKWEWMKKGELKRENQSLLFAAQEQTIRTNSLKYSTDKTSETALCRLCNENVKSVIHIISTCPNLAKNQYRKRHHKVAKKFIGNYAKSST